jgi:hypothetical protein
MPQYMMAVFQGFLVVAGCVQGEDHSGTPILMCIPEAHESKRRICQWDANRALLLFLDGDYGQADSERAELPWRLPPAARDGRN